MNLIKYKPFTNSKTLRESILNVMDKVLKDSHTYQEVIFSLLMREISSKVRLRLLTSDYNAKMGYWSRKYGPCKEHELAPNKLNSYYITIFKYFDKNEYTLTVISCRELIVKETKMDVIDWIKEYNKNMTGDLQLDKKNCVIS